MTIEQAIAKVDSLKPNQYDTEIKVDWLSSLDGLIHDTIVLTHEIPEGTSETFEAYSSDDMTTDLIAPFPYDEMYIYYLIMKIDESNNELTRYNNSATMFNAKLDDFRGAYIRKNLPLKAPRFRYRER